jgi:protocatechuate 3,4-dioxygenase, beta subunit
MPMTNLLEPGGAEGSRSIKRRRTPDQILGPYFPVGGKPCTDGDLASIKGQSGCARGKIIEVVGRVLDRDGTPVSGAKLIVWQANSFGRYTHPADSNPAPLDSNFFGFADIRSDQDGAYRIRTVKPGAYPIDPDTVRPPHIHFEVQGQFERLITQMYFPGEPLNAHDRFLMSASRPESLIATPLPPTRGHQSIMEFDIILARG